ncbi:MAG: AsmA family protein [Bacteroidia bacterium]|nr:AsmA family protein [Bacteroidia bacterium]
MKKTFIIISVVLAILFGTLILVPFLFKDKIVELVKQQANNNINANVNFNNDISLSLIKNFPNFTIGIKDLSVVGIEDFDGDTLISWANMEATVDVMSVINGDQIKVRKILLESPIVHALVLNNGKANWDIAKADTTTQTITDTAQTKFNLSLNSLEVTNANIVYDDKVGNIYTNLSAMDYNMTGDFTQDIFNLSILSSIKQFNMAYGGVTYLSKVNTNIKMDLDMNMPEMKFTFKENTFSLNDLQFNFDGFVQMLNDDINMDIKFGANQASFKSFLSLVPGVYTKDFADVKTA